jgi:hypothetical protein
MSKPLGKESVRSAVERIYPELPVRFSMMKLHSMVCREIRRPYLYLDTSRRKLFQLREEGLISFENIDKAKSIYRKLERL